MKDFRGIEITDTGNEALVEQSGFHRPIEFPEFGMECIGTDRKCICSEHGGAEKLIALLCRPDVGGPQTTTIPIDDLATIRKFQMDHDPNMLEGRRIRDQGQSRHLGLQDDPILVVESDQNPFSDSVDGQDRSALETCWPSDRFGAHRNRSVAILWKLDLGYPPTDCREQSTPHGFDFG
jgi:hypothetical protein